jgi:hypothetical protein
VVWSWRLGALVYGGLDVCSFGGPTVGIGINSGLATWKSPGRCIGGLGLGVGLGVGRRGSSRSRRGALGLPLLCTTLSSSSLSSLVIGVGKDLKGIIVLCHSLMYDRHTVDSAWFSDCV